MRNLQILSVFVLLIGWASLQAQNGPATIKVTDVDGKTTTVKMALSSASSSCDSPDFPVIRNGEREDISLHDVKFITIMPYVPASNETLFITAELETEKGAKEQVEISRFIRFSGQAGTEDFSMVITEISMVEVVK
jgi:hypothetical protein